MIVLYFSMLVIHSRCAQKGRRKVRFNGGETRGRQTAWRKMERTASVQQRLKRNSRQVQNNEARWGNDLPLNAAFTLEITDVFAAFTNITTYKYEVSVFFIRTSYAERFEIQGVELQKEKSLVFFLDLGMAYPRGEQSTLHCLACRPARPLRITIFFPSSASSTALSVDTCPWGIQFRITVVPMARTSLKFWKRRHPSHGESDVPKFSILSRLSTWGCL